ncbi:MAG: hypothetical protein FJ308_23535 [Planctomycetes bacterium]|nr:hypothetical protein [Planctomycetota bacterium]
MPAAIVIGTSQMLGRRYLARGHWKYRELPLSLRPQIPWMRWERRVWSVEIILAMARFIRYWPERLREPHRTSRCQLSGTEHWTAALETGRPMVLVTLHYSDLTERYHRLRAYGTAICFLATRDLTSGPQARAYRNYLDTLADSANGLDGVPRLFEPGQLLEVRDFLHQSGGMVAVATEELGQGHHDIAQSTGIGIRVSPGALRLAALLDAIRFRMSSVSIAVFRLVIWQASVCDWVEVCNGIQNRNNVSRMLKRMQCFSVRSVQAMK